MLSTDTFFGFARCSYLGSVDLTLSGISITQGRAALKWLPGSLEVSAGCGMYLQGKSVILFPGDWSCNKGSFSCWRGQVWGSSWFGQPSETQSMENVELPIKATSHLPYSIKLQSIAIPWETRRLSDLRIICLSMFGFKLYLPRPSSVPLCRWTAVMLTCISGVYKDPVTLTEHFTSDA